MKLSPLAVEVLCAVALALIALIIAPGPGALAVAVVVVLALVAFSLVPSAVGAWRRRRSEPRGRRDRRAMS